MVTYRIVFSKQAEKDKKRLKTAGLEKKQFEFYGCGRITNNRKEIYRRR